MASSKAEPTPSHVNTATKDKSYFEKMQNTLGKAKVIVRGMQTYRKVVHKKNSCPFVDSLPIINSKQL